MNVNVCTSNKLFGSICPHSHSNNWIFIQYIYWVRVWCLKIYSRILIIVGNILSLLIMKHLVCITKKNPYIMALAYSVQSLRWIYEFLHSHDKSSVSKTWFRSGLKNRLQYLPFTCIWELHHLIHLMLYVF